MTMIKGRDQPAADSVSSFGECKSFKDMVNDHEYGCNAT